MGGFKLVTSWPDCCKIDCLCCECGCRDLPNLGSDWWCEGVCLCCFRNCGMKELIETQICCIGPCTPPAFKTTMAFPDCCVINCLCMKYGLKDFPSLYTESLIEDKCLCWECSAGMNNMNLFSNQFFCCSCK